MGRVAPQYTRTEVDRAGAVLAAEDHDFGEYDHALEVINNWRSSHSFPLNTFQIWPTRRSRAINPDSLVAQRIKRLSSIRAKISRFPSIRLSQMQDIGGCRAVVQSVEEVDELVKRLEESYLREDWRDQPFGLPGVGRGGSGARATASFSGTGTFVLVGLFPRA
jgi:ppGpp synthetase/RelA/SpoT-type nucleotidyltranferase